MLSTTGILSPTTSLELSVGRAHNSLEYQLQNRTSTARRRASPGCRCCSRTPCRSDYIPDFRVPRRPHGRQRGLSTRPTAVRSRTRTRPTDILANLSKIWGSHSAKFGVYYQHSFKPQSIFAAFNSQIQFQDDANNPFDTGLRLRQRRHRRLPEPYTQANKYALPEWNYKNIEWYVQDNWKATRKLTLDYGVRFYYWTPQWDTTLQASNFLPDKFDASAGGERSTGRSASALIPARATTGAAWIRRSSTRAWRPRWGTPSPIASSAASCRARTASTAPSRPARASTTPCRTATTPSACRPGSASPTTSPATGDDRPRRRRDLLRPPAGQPGLRHGRQRARRARLQRAVGTAAGPRSGRPGRPVPDAVAESPSAFDFKPPKIYPVERRRPAQALENLIFDVAYVGSKSTDLLRQWQINSVPARREVPAPEPGSDPRAQRDSGRHRAARRPAAALSRATTPSACGTTSGGQLPRLQTAINAPVRQRVHVLGVLRLEQGPDRRNNNDFARATAGLPCSHRSSRRTRSGGSTTPTPATTARTTSCSTSSTRCPRSRAAPSA